LDRARGRVGWHLNLDVGVSDIDDCRIGPVKSDAGRALQVISQNSDLPADSACVGERLHEWAKACGQAVNRAAVGATRTVAAGVRRPVKNRWWIERLQPAGLSHPRIPTRGKSGEVRYRRPPV